MNTIWIYIQSEIFSRDGADLFTVGFYDPSGKFQPESDHSTREEAAARVHFLNGGDNNRFLVETLEVAYKHLIRDGHLGTARRVQDAITMAVGVKKA